MKKRYGMMLAVMVGASVVARAAEVTVDYYSAYVWRGQVINSAAVVQPAISAELPFGLTLGAWGNVDATKKYELAGKFNEVDLSASYDLPIEGPVGVSLGVVNYLYPYQKEYTVITEEGEVEESAGTDETTEISVTVTGDVLLAPTLTIVRDVDNVKGFYANIGISHSLPILDKMALDLGASVGWADKNYNEAYFGPDDEGFNDFNLSVSSSYEVMENLSLGATVAYAYLIDNEIRDAAKEWYGYKDHIYAGLNLAYSF